MQTFFFPSSFDNYTANVLALVSTFYSCVKNPPIDEGDSDTFIFVMKRKFLTQFLQNLVCIFLIDLR